MSLDIKLNSHVNFLKTHIQSKLPKLPADALSVPPRKQTESFWFRTKYADFSNLLHEHEMRTMKEHLNQIRCSLWVESFVLSTSALWGGCPFENFCQRLDTWFYPEMGGKSFWDWPSFVFSWKMILASFSGFIMHDASCIVIKCWWGSWE